ncbi:MAG TPA: hypothetical protein VGR62_11460 [Candidatus Binatia bacterium]|nr:hypothetical protein [Candidatus Binatia bacterium]
MMLLVLLGAATAQGETAISIAASQPPSGDVVRPVAAASDDGAEPKWPTKLLGLPSAETIQAVVNGRRLVPANR